MYSALNDNKSFTVIFLDISKYFDKIWHDKLIAKYEIHYNISGSLLSWLISYLNDHSQAVRVGSSISGLQKKIQLAVPRARCLDLCWISCI